MGFTTNAAVVVWVFFAALAAGTDGRAAEFAPPQFPKDKIVVLGTYHMANPGHDTFNLEADDVLLPGRQRQIQEVVDGLARFKPTKLLLESDWDSDQVQQEYKSYLAGDYELTRNEIDQIGYRLAKRLGHQTVYPVDYDLSMDAGVDHAALERLYPAVEEELNSYGQSYTDYQAAALKRDTIGQYLALMNTPAMIDANHFFYMAYSMKIGEGDAFVGPEMVANWYKRNIMILHNIMRVADPDGSDRLLVIIGQGHVKILDQLLDDSPYFDREDVLDYLPAP